MIWLEVANQMLGGDVLARWVAIEWSMPYRISDPSCRYWDHPFIGGALIDIFCALGRRLT